MISTVAIMVASGPRLAAAAERGGTVLGGPVDTPYGRMAMITDPQGATFAIMGVVSEG